MVLDPTTALRKANQVGSLQPTILVSYNADLRPIFDTRNQDGLEQYGMTEAILVDPAWRMKMLDSLTVLTQDFAGSLIADGFAGVLIKSFAKGASALDFNIVLWNWTCEGCVLNVVDNEDRLSRT